MAKLVERTPDEESKRLSDILGQVNSEMAKLEEMRALKEKLSVDISSLDNACVNAKSDLDSNIALAKKAKDGLAETERIISNEMLSLKIEKDIHKDDVLRSETIIEGAKKEFSSLSQKKAKAYEELSSLEAEISAKKVELADLKAYNDSQAKELGRSISNAQDRLKTALVSLENANNDIVSTTIENNIAKADISSLGNEKIDLINKIDALKIEVGILSSTKARLDAELSSVKCDIKKADEEIVQKKESMLGLVAKENKLNEAISKVQELYRKAGLEVII